MGGAFKAWCCVPLALCVMLGCAKRQKSEPSYANAEQIILRRVDISSAGERFGDTIVTISDSGTVAKFISQLALVPKTPCDCLHRDSVTFRTPDGNKVVSICDHCFGGYEMPKGVYSLFTNEIENATQPPPATS
jgi:hypothetical protein